MVSNTLLTTDELCVTGDGGGARLVHCWAEDLAGRVGAARVTFLAGKCSFWRDL